MLFDLIVLPLCSFGFAISLFFTLVAYNKLAPNNRFVPRWCRMDNKTCLYVVHAPQARIFGLPNSLLGMGYYPAVAAFSIRILPVTSFIATAISAIPVMLGIYLIYALRVQLRTHCLLCYVAHGINTAIFLSFLLITR